MVIIIPKEIVVTRYELGTKFTASAAFVISRGCTDIYISHMFSFINTDLMAFGKHLSFALNIN